MTTALDSTTAQPQHLYRHGLVHTSLPRSIWAFGGVAALGGEGSPLCWATQLMQVQWRTGGWQVEVQALAEVGLGHHLLGGLTQEVVGRRPRTLLHLPGVGRKGEP